MNILKFYQYLKEDIYLPIVDVVIDENGNVYNGSSDNDNGLETKITKGSIERVSKTYDLIDADINPKTNEPFKTRTESVIRSIIGTDNKIYPAGIDKNGNLVAVRKDANNYVLGLCSNCGGVGKVGKRKKCDVCDGEGTNNNRIPLPKRLSTKYKEKYWKEGIDYIDLVPIIPTGWVNVKVDMEVVKRVRRYSTGLGNNKPGFNNFLVKLTQFQHLSNLERQARHVALLKKRTIQKEMSVIVLLHYINEIKDFFTPSQSGFLFESFIAGLIPNAKINDDNTSADITAGQDEYQIKLYKNDGINATLSSDGRLLDYYIIGIKHIGKIELFTINSNSIEHSLSQAKDLGIITNNGSFSLKKLRDKAGVNNTDPVVKRFNIDLSNIEKRIENLGESLKDSIHDLYNELSKFQYNVEALLTGQDEKGKLADFDKSYTNAEGNIKSLKEKLEDIKTNIKK